MGRPPVGPRSSQPSAGAGPHLSLGPDKVEDVVPGLTRPAARTGSVARGQSRARRASGLSTPQVMSCSVSCDGVSS